MRLVVATLIQIFFVKAEFVIPNSYSAAVTHPYWPVFSLADTSCESYVTDFASNGADRIIIVGNTNSDRYINEDGGKSTCLTTPSPNNDLLGVPYIVGIYNDGTSTTTAWQKFIPNSYMGASADFNNLAQNNEYRQMVAVAYSGPAGLYTSATSAPVFKRPLFAVYMKAYSDSSVAEYNTPKYSSLVLIMDETDGTIKKILSAANYHWSPIDSRHPFIF
jgi:hypothetical protein